MKKTILLIAFLFTTGILLFFQVNDSRTCNATNCFSLHYKFAHNDTTIYDIPTNTAQLPDDITYFKQNNKYKDWDKNNSKVVILQGIVEKDGTISRVRILRSSNEKKLDEEALRLIKSAQYIPGKNAKGEDVRSKFSILVHFPAK